MKIKRSEHTRMSARLRLLENMAATRMDFIYNDLGNPFMTTTFEERYMRAVMGAADTRAGEWTIRITPPPQVTMTSPPLID